MQSNLNPHLRQRIQPLILASSRVSEQRGHTVAHSRLPDGLLIFVPILVLAAALTLDWNLRRDQALHWLVSVILLDPLLVNAGVIVLQVSGLLLGLERHQ